MRQHIPETKLIVAFFIFTIPAKPRFAELVQLVVDEQKILTAIHRKNPVGIFLLLLNLIIDHPTAHLLVLVRFRNDFIIGLLVTHKIIFFIGNFAYGHGV